MFASRPLVEDLPNSATISAPGWAYVPDVGLDPVKAGHRPANRKRTARGPGGSGGGASSAAATSRLEAARLRKIADLDRDNARDAAITIPSRGKESRAKGKTANTRKILQAQKTFANYLADDEAWAALAAEQPAPHANQYTAQSRAHGSTAGATQKATAQKPQRSESSAAAAIKPDPDSGASEPPQPTAHGPPPAATNPFWNPPAPPTPLAPAEQRLLRVHTPSAPTQEQMRELTHAPALTFAAARADIPDHGLCRPKRYFCELCGFSARQRCAACGGRVCGTRGCAITHEAERCVKYGA